MNIKISDAQVFPAQPSLTEREEHDKLQAEVVRDLAAQIALGERIETRQIEIVIDPRYDNSLVRDFAIKNGIVSKGVFNEMVRKARVKEELGSVPQNAQHLVQIVTKRDRVECKFDGTLTRNIAPFVLDQGTGEKLFFTPDLMKDEAVQLQAFFHFPTDLNFLDFERELRIANDNLKLGFSREAISDALTQWYEQAKRSRLQELFITVGSGKPVPSHRETAAPMWSALVARVFDTTHCEPEFVVAVLKKFIWQVKRKVRKLPVTNHLMPVLLGPQGVGKTTFVKKFTGVLAELSLEVDFKMIEDDRNIDIWNSYILFLDEMGYASKANVDSIKHAITATSLARRPMRTNSKVMVNQNATFIGCSNKTLAQLIKDPTGIRRFVGLQFSTAPCRETMNTIDYVALWLSVGVEDEDPMLPFMSLLSDKQEEDREKGRVEEWLTQFDPHAAPAKDFGTTFGQVSKNGKILAADLFRLYSEWESVMYPGSFGRMNVNEFGHEMKRLVDNSPEKVPFAKGTRCAKGVTWIYNGQSNVVPIPRHGSMR